MNKKRKLKIAIAAILSCILLTGSLTACTGKYMKPENDEAIYYDIVQVLGQVRVAEGFFASYASVIPSVFVDGNYSLTYEKTTKDGEEVYIAIVSGEYYPDYNDSSTKTGTIKFLMKLEDTKGTALAPWPYEDPDRIDDAIWKFVTHKDVSEKER